MLADKLLLALFLALILAVLLAPVAVIAGPPAWLPVRDLDMEEIVLGAILAVNALALPLLWLRGRKRDAGPT